MEVIRRYEIFVTMQHEKQYFNCLILNKKKLVKKPF